MSRQITVGIAGQGRSGFGIHYSWLKKVPEQYRIVAVADEYPERTLEAKQEFGASVYADWRQMLEEADFELMVVALPSFMHHEVSLAALEAGKHVVCEKPIAATAEEVDRLAAAAKEAQRVYFPFQNNRFQPFFDKITEVLESGILGRIVNVRSCWAGYRRRWDWQTLQKNLGGVLFNTGPHAVDQALSIFGWDKMPEIFCRMQCHNPFGADAEDHCSVTLYDPERQRPDVDILISAYTAYPQGGMYNVSGTYGGLEGGSGFLRWKYINPEKAPKQALWKRWSENRSYPGEELEWTEKEWKYDPGDEAVTSGYTLTSFQTGPKRIYDNLHDILTGKTRTQIVTLEQAKRQIAVIDECHRQNPFMDNR